MANTYTQLYTHLVFAMDMNSILPQKRHREELEKYICGIVSGLRSKVYAIFCNPDHIHLLVSVHPQLSTADLVKKIKSNSSKWMNQEAFGPSKFRWQIGYCAFAVARSGLKTLIHFIENQEAHHRLTTLQSEYKSLLEEHEIDYVEQYLFTFS